MFRARQFIVASALCTGFVAPAAARDYHATPANYRAFIAELKPGDRLLLAPGDYDTGLSLSGISGTADAPIVIQGARSPGVSRLRARRSANTVSLRNVSHVVIDSLVLDGLGLPVDAVKAEGDAAYAHHVTLSRLTIVNHGADQQSVGISTKCPAAGWVVRDNSITGAGTGMYFGNSDGSAPFVAGLIEGNIVVDTIGYNIQIKHQLPRPAGIGLPAGPGTTVIRRNLFAKSGNSSSGVLARPNLLIGHLPTEGEGSSDRYLVYGNVFLGNPFEALLQAEGHVAIYNNVFMNAQNEAIAIQPHNHLPRSIAVFNNTIVARGRGLAMRDGDPAYAQEAIGNVIVAAESPIGASRDNNFIEGGAGAPALFNAAQNGEAALDLGLRQSARTALRTPLPPRLNDLPEAGHDLFRERRLEGIPGAFATSRGDLSAFLETLAAARRPARQ